LTSALTQSGVVVLYDLDGSGKAANIRVDESVPRSVFDSAVIKSVEETHYAANTIRKDCRQVFNFRISSRAPG
jgi:TonB family protein